MPKLKYLPGDEVYFQSPEGGGRKVLKVIVCDRDDSYLPYLLGPVNTFIGPEQHAAIREYNSDNFKGLIKFFPWHITGPSDTPKFFWVDDGLIVGKSKTFGKLKKKLYLLGIDVKKRC